MHLTFPRGIKNFCLLTCEENEVDIWDHLRNGVRKEKLGNYSNNVSVSSQTY